MSKVNFDIDTDSGQMSVTIDGQGISNVVGATVYWDRDWDTGEKKLKVNIQSYEEVGESAKKHSCIEAQELVNPMSKEEMVDYFSNLLSGK